MSDFIVTENYQGYVQGTRRYRVEADTPGEAEDNYLSGQVIDDDIARDDTDSEIDEVEEVAPVTTGHAEAVIENHLEEFMKPEGVFLVVKIAETLGLEVGGEDEYDRLHEKIKEIIKEVL